jgi:hypothetical protein
MLEWEDGWGQNGGHVCVKRRNAAAPDIVLLDGRWTYFHPSDERPAYFHPAVHPTALSVANVEWIAVVSLAKVSNSRMDVLTSTYHDAFSVAYDEPWFLHT